ncbi:MAG TPA: aminoacyl-tRNA hydrolase [bacterium]|nr:aminoacyl-tRNA hydrolase [bacterium]
MAAETWMVVGLGNPGENYRFTRHNVGFRVVEALVLKHGVKLREKDEAIFGSYPLEGREVFLFFPQTFMNESGRAVGPFARYRNIPPEKILVVSDDLDLPVGKIRLRPSGGSGGHHGLDSIIAHLDGSGFPRLRIGISKPPSSLEGANHVLATFTPEEKPKIEKAVERSRDGIETFILKGPEAAMNELNRDVPEGQ